MKTPYLFALVLSFIAVFPLSAQNGKPDAEGFIRDWLVLAPLFVDDSGAEAIDKKQLASEAKPAAQEGATLGNLTMDGIGVDAGYVGPTTLSDGEDGLFTKPAIVDYPAYLKATCASDPNGSCTTIHYKSATRAHIESLGYDIVANFGDQFSDLIGGSADRTFKMPNPNYFLP